MAKTTTKAVIKAIEASTGDKGVELVKGAGYLYFVHPTFDFTEGASVMVPYLSDLSVERWVEEYRALKAASLRYNLPESLTMAQFTEHVRTLLRDKPAGTGLKDGDVGEFFMDGESVFACADGDDREADAVDLDESAWNGDCWDGSTLEKTMTTIMLPVFLPARGAA